VRVINKITHHARLRVEEYTGSWKEDHEIEMMSLQPNSPFRFVWNSTLSAKACVRTLITVIPKKNPVKPNYNKEVRCALY